jgi:hypothetical protein
LQYPAKLELNTAEGEAYRTRLDIGNIFKQGGTADDAKSSIETFNNVPKIKAAKPSLFSVEYGSSLNF